MRLAVAFALLAVATPASAQQASPPPRGSERPVIVEVRGPDGFDWLDAAVGAAAGVALVLSVGGAWLALPPGRSRVAREHVPAPGRGGGSSLQG
jgi:hypothetical protein